MFSFPFNNILNFVSAAGNRSSISKAHNFKIKCFGDWDSESALVLGKNDRVKNNIFQ